MRILGGWSNAGWYVTCALLSVCARSAVEQVNEMYIGRWRSPDSKSMASGYGFGELFASKSSGIVGDSLEESEEVEEEEEEVPSTMRAITSKAKSDVVLLPLIIEPEAEMLPPGYKGVKPPGVSHMELMFVKPQTGRSSSRRSSVTRASPAGGENPGKFDEFDQDRDAYYSASERETQITRNDRGNDRRVAFGTGATGKRSDRSELTESSGKNKSYSEGENRAGDHADGIAWKKDASYGTGDSRERARNAAGYRDVYHRDGIEEDADLYDKGRHAGHLERRGRYGDRYDAAEGMTRNRRGQRFQTDRDENR